MSKEKGKNIKNFYGNDVDILEIEINDFLVDGKYILDALNVTYLPDPERNPNRTYLLFTITFHSADNRFFNSKHFDDD